MPVYTNGIDFLALMQKTLNKLVELKLISQDELNKMVFDCSSPQMQEAMKNKESLYNGDGITYET